MKQVALRNRFGLFYYPSVYVILVLIPIIAMVEWGYILLASLLPAGNRAAKLHIIATTPVNVSLIESALLFDSDLRKHQIDRDLLQLSRLAAEIGWRQVISCITGHLQLFIHIICFSPARRKDLILHSRDALLLLMLICYAQSRLEHIFVTEDHYQRWSYLLSHHSPNLLVVQHGALDPNIRFTHSFGIIKTLYLSNLQSKLDFESYYKILETKHFLPSRRFKQNNFSEDGIFIASSFPFIDMEIELVRVIKDRINAPIILKLHPAHCYDLRKYVLSNMASYICGDDEYPNCHLFVSYNSYMENDYIARGIPSFSIERMGGVLATVDAISSHLMSDASFSD